MCCENFLKSFTKFEVEDGIDDRVEGAVRVSKPCEAFEHDGRNAGLAEGRDNIYAEERYPADQKYSHDDTCKLRST